MWSLDLKAKFLNPKAQEVGLSSHWTPLMVAQAENKEIENKQRRGQVSTWPKSSDTQGNTIVVRNWGASDFLGTQSRAKTLPQLILGADLEFLRF